METLRDVDYLQIELSDALSRRCELESEIHRLVQSVSQGPIGTLSILPTEIFVEILQLTLQDNPVEIHRLPLVCRAWSLVIQETPQLWTNIRIAVPLEPNLVKKCADYCSMVLEKSARCPLDISIDYSKLETVVKSLEESIKAKEAVFKPTFFESIWRFILERGEGNDPMYKYYINCYFEPLKRLSGDNFSGSARWRSFELLSGSLFYVLSVPGAAFAANIFAGSTPILESLKLSYSSKWTVEGEDRSGCSGWRKRMPRPFPFSPNLHEIVLSNVFMPISIHSIDPLKLKRLQIHCCDTEQFQFTLRCQNLTHLYMGKFKESEDILQSLAPGEFLFPRLVHLDLATSVPEWFFSSMVAPHLDSISFVNHDAFKAIKWMILPASVTKVECRWPFAYCLINDTLKSGLSAVVQSPSVTTVLCSVRYQENAERALKRLSSDGFKSPTLSSLVILPSYNSSESEVLDTVDLQQLL